MKLGQFFVISFCSLFLLFVGPDRAQNTKDVEMHMNTRTSKNIWSNRDIEQNSVQGHRRVVQPYGPVTLPRIVLYADIRW